jgi:hypothetical protein
MTTNNIEHESTLRPTYDFPLPPLENDLGSVVWYTG